MKIVFLLSTLSNKAGGVFQVIQGLYNNSSINNNVIPIGSWDEEYNCSDWKYGQPITYESIILKKFGYCLKLYKTILAVKPNIIHLHGIWMYNQYISLRLQRKNNFPVIISPHGMLDPWALNVSKWKKYIVGKIFVNSSLQSAKCIHALCQSELESIRKYGLTNPVAIIPNGIEIPINKIKRDPPWMIYPNKKILLYIGRIHPKKGLKDLIEALNIISENRPEVLVNWNVKIVGWSQLNHEIELKKLVQKYNLGKTIEFPGPLFCDQKEAALQNSDAFILPSYSEGLPMSILEAWAYGVPVLQTIHCNIPEGFENNAAIKIDNNPNKLASQLIDFMSLSESEINKIGKNGYKLVNDKYTWMHVTNQMLQLYNWVLKGGEKPEFVYL